MKHYLDHFEIIRVDETDSTNNAIRNHEHSPGKEFLVISAEYQTGGKGQRGNSWESARGKNLLFSLSCHPTFLHAQQQFLLSQIISLSVLDVFRHYIRRFSIKWPNDIYVGHCKICGMLLEHDLRGGVISRTIIGPGINVNQRIFRSDAPNPVSLFQLLHHTVSREEVMERFLQRFADYYARLEGGGATDEIHRTYHERLYRRDGRLHRFRDAGGEFLARLDGVESDGHLLLTDETGHGRCYAFKEIQYVLCS